MEQLELNDITFNELFILKSYNLKTLFDKDKQNIELLELSNTTIIRPEKLSKFPNLKKYFINNIYNKYFFNLSIFDIVEISTFKKTDTKDIYKINDNSSMNI